MESQHHTTTTTTAVADDAAAAGPSTSSQSPSAAEEAESELLVQQETEPTAANNNNRRSRRQPTTTTTTTSVSHRFNVPDLVSSDMRDDVWSCLVVLVTFWFFASMTLILGFYGAEELHLGPSCSRLVLTNQLFVQSIKGQLEDQVSGPMFYGFRGIPPLDVETTWTESHSVSVPANYHQEWEYYLNMGSYVDVSYDVKSPSYASMSLVIAQGEENLIEWVDDPSYPNSTLSWNIIYGSGKIEQEIMSSGTYYIAIGNLNSEVVEVVLNFTIKATLYNTSQATFKCSLSDTVCVFDLSLLQENVAVLTSPSPLQAKEPDAGWYVNISYGPRWATYIVGSGVMTIIILALFRFCNMWQANQEQRARYQTTEAGQGSQEPLLSPKDDDLSSWGSSYDSASHDEEDLEEQIQEGKPQKEGDQSNSNPRRLCVICYDAPRDCFFLPCGHCAACFACGSKIAEEVGTCPICRRKMKKVRKIFSV